MKNKSERDFHINVAQKLKSSAMSQYRLWVVKLACSPSCSLVENQLLINQ